MDEHGVKDMGRRIASRRPDETSPPILAVVGSAFTVGAGAAFVLTSGTGAQVAVAGGLLLLVGALAGYLVLSPHRRPGRRGEHVPALEFPITARPSDLDAEFFSILAASSLGDAPSRPREPEHEDRTEGS